MWITGPHGGIYFVAERGEKNCGRAEAFKWSRITSDPREGGFVRVEAREIPARIRRRITTQVRRDKREPKKNKGIYRVERGKVRSKSGRIIQDAIPRFTRISTWKKRTSQGGTDLGSKSYERVCPSIAIVPVRSSVHDLGNTI